MSDTDRGGRLVDMLSTGTAGTVGIDPQIVLIDLNVKIFLDLSSRKHSLR